MLAKTFGLNGETIEVVPVKKYGAGLFVCETIDGKQIVRHIDRLEPLNEETRKFLGK